MKHRIQFLRRRREFISLLGAAAAAWPRAARAQQGERMQRIGVLEPIAVDDPEALARVTAFAQGLHQLGWTASRNVRIDYRWGAGDADRLRGEAAAVVAAAPAMIIANSTPVLSELRKQSTTLPMVFVQVTDPVGSGFVPNLTRPGGNLTGFTNFEPSIDQVRVGHQPQNCKNRGRYRAVGVARPNQ